MKLSDVTKYMKSEIKVESIPAIAQNMHAVVSGTLLNVLEKEMKDPGVKMFWHIVKALKDLTVVYGGGIPIALESATPIDEHSIDIYTSAYGNVCNVIKKNVIPDIVDAGYSFIPIEKVDSSITEWEVRCGSLSYSLRCVHETIPKGSRVDRGGYIGVNHELHIASAIAKLCIVPLDWKPPIARNLALYVNTPVNMSKVIENCREHYSLDMRDIIEIQMGMAGNCEIAMRLQDEVAINQWKAVLDFLADLTLCWRRAVKVDDDEILVAINSQLGAKMVIGGKYALKMAGLLPYREVGIVELLAEHEVSYGRNALLHLTKHPKAHDIAYCKSYGACSKLLQPEPERAIIDYAMSAVVSGDILDEVVINYIHSAENLDKLYEVAGYCGKGVDFIDALICHAYYNTDINQLIK